MCTSGKETTISDRLHQKCGRHAFQDDIDARGCQHARASSSCSSTTSLSRSPSTCQLTCKESMKDSSSTGSSRMDEEAHGDNFEDALNFPFDLFEVDPFLDKDEEEALMDAYQDLIVEGAMARQSSSRRCSMLAAMNYINTSASRTGSLSLCSTDYGERRVDTSGSVTTLMEKLQESMRRTAESRAQLLGLVNGLDKQASCTFVKRSKRHFLSLGHQKAQLTRSRDARRTPSRPTKKLLRCSGSTTTVSRRKDTASEYACSGVLLKRAAYACSGVLLKKAEYACSGVLLKNTLPQSINTESLASRPMASKATIHEILRLKKTAGWGGNNGKFVSSCQPTSSGITSFLRQTSKKGFI
jgi:hypothetical protein